MSVDSDIARLVLTNRRDNARLALGERIPVGPRVESWEYLASMTNEAPHYTLHVGDADEQLRRSGVLDRQDDEVLDQGVTCTIDGLRWEVVSVRPSGSTVDVIVEPQFVARLRRRNRPRVFRRDAYTRAGALRTLIRTEEPEVTFVCPARGERAAAERDRDAKIRATKSAVDSKAAGPSGIPDDAKLTVKGAPASPDQIRVGELVLQECAAQDAGPKARKAAMLAAIVESQVQNLPGGDRDSRGVIQIRDSTARGIGVDNRDVRDSIRVFLTRGFYSIYATGGSIPAGRGGAINIAQDKPTMTAGQVAQSCQGSGVPDAYDRYSAEADEWIDAFDGSGETKTGAAPRGTADTARDEWRRGGTDGELESTWDMGVRLGGEVRWAWFATLDTEIVYADERDLLRSRAAAILKPHEGSVDFIDGGWDVGHGVDTITVDVRGITPRSAPHGCPVIVRDAGPTNGRYLIESTRISSGSDSGTLTLRRARDPKREPVRETTSSPAAKADKKNTPIRERIVAEAVKTLTVKDNGAPGTGHRYYSWDTRTAPNLQDPTPGRGRSDCSQWVAAVYALAGAPFPGANTYEQNARGRRTSSPKPGDLMLTGNIEHVELYVGRGSWKGNTIGHGSEPIDRDDTNNWPGHHFVTFLDDGDDDASDAVGEGALGQTANRRG